MTTLEDFPTFNPKGSKRVQTFETSG